MIYYYDGGDEMEYCKKIVRSDEEKKRLLSRINRISGEVNCIKKMIEDDTYCNDILIQVIAAKKAIKSVLYTSFVCNYFCFIL